MGIGQNFTILSVVNLSVYFPHSIFRKKIIELTYLFKPNIFSPFSSYFDGSFSWEFFPYSKKYEQDQVQNFSWQLHLLIGACWKVEFVIDWVMKSPKRLFTFSDIPHRSCWHVGILPKDSDLIANIRKIWLDS